MGAKRVGWVGRFACRCCISVLRGEQPGEQHLSRGSTVQYSTVQYRNGTDGDYASAPRVRLPGGAARGTPEERPTEPNYGVARGTGTCVKHLGVCTRVIMNGLARVSELPGS